MPMTDPGTQGPMDVSGRQVTPPRSKSARSQWLKLAAIIPAALKGGPGAVEGLLAGFQQSAQLQQRSAQQQFENDRLTANDARAAQQQAWLQDFQSGQQARQLENDKVAFIKDYRDMLVSEDLDNPGAVQALEALFEERARALGIRPGALSAIAAQVAAPAQLLRRRIQKRWNGMSATERQLAQQSQATLTIDGEPIPFASWSAAVGGMTDPKTGAYPQAPQVDRTPVTPGSFEDYVTRYAAEKGIPVEKLTASQLEDARSRFNRSDDRPPQQQAPQGSPQWVLDSDGNEHYRIPRQGDRRSPAESPRTTTEGERKAASFLAQMEAAAQKMDELEARLTETDIYQFGLPQDGLFGAFNRNRLSEAGKSYLQALEQFTEGRLRTLSGATITPAEYEQYRRTYARQHGETPDLAQQRRAARQSVLDAQRGMAGRGASTSPTPPQTPRTNPFRK